MTFRYLDEKELKKKLNEHNIPLDDVKNIYHNLRKKGIKVMEKNLVAAIIYKLSKKYRYPLPMSFCREIAGSEMTQKSFKKVLKKFKIDGEKTFVSPEEIIRKRHIYKDEIEKILSFYKIVKDDLKDFSFPRVIAAIVVYTYHRYFSNRFLTQEDVAKIFMTNTVSIRNGYKTIKKKVESLKDGW